jgi:methyl-accepting chemotaxis protein
MNPDANQSLANGQWPAADVLLETLGEPAALADPQTGALLVSASFAALASDEGWPAGAGEAVELLESLAGPRQRWNRGAPGKLQLAGGRGTATVVPVPGSALFLLRVHAAEGQQAFPSAQLERCASALERAAAGELDRPWPKVEDSRLASLAEAGERLVRSYRGTLGHFAQSGSGLTAAAERLNVVSAQLTDQASQTSDRAGRVASAATEVGGSVNSVAAAAEEMGASIHEISNSAAEATAVAMQAVQFATTANDTVARLGQSGEQIGRFAKVITGIAQQTNLLALNATIEAARAGAAGRGFAVVASEVKELAKETAKATDDIGRRIEAIQSDTEAAVEAIVRIADVIDRIHEIQTNIAGAVEEQSATASEISRAAGAAARRSGEIAEHVADVARVAQGTLQGAAETARAADELSTLAQGLSQSLGTLRPTR